MPDTSDVSGRVDRRSSIESAVSKAHELSAQGKHALAIAEYDECLRALQTDDAVAAIPPPTNARDLDHDRAYLLWLKAQAHQELNQFAKALESYETALKARERLASGVPTSTQESADLAFAHEDIGNALVKLHRLDKAKLAYEAGLDVLKRGLNAGDGKTTDYFLFQYNIAKFNAHIGNVLLDQRRYDDAQRAYTKAVSIWHAIAEFGLFDAFDAAHEIKAHINSLEDRAPGYEVIVKGTFSNVQSEIASADENIIRPKSPALPDHTAKLATELVAEAGIAREYRQGVIGEILALLANSKNEVQRAPSMKPPVRQLSEKEIAALISFGKAHAYSQRRKNDTRNPYEWVRDEYAKWYPGILMHHLKKADQGLWTILQQRRHRARKGKYPAPSWFDVPTREENNYRAATPSQRVAIGEARRVFRAANAKLKLIS